MSDPDESMRRELPSDPNAEYYLTNCFVCQEEAKPGQVNVCSDLLTKDKKKHFIDCCSEIVHREGTPNQN
jgi:hypothetical protein